MRRLISFGAAVLALALSAGAASARDIPPGGLTLAEVAGWLQQSGYKVESKTTAAGVKYLDSAAEGVNFDIYLYDCKDDRCASMQFAAGFDMKAPGLAGGRRGVRHCPRGLARTPVRGRAR